MISHQAAQSDEIRIIHAAVPGRVRLRVPGLRGSERLKSHLAERLSHRSSVRAVWPNTDTGNALILFEPPLSAGEAATLVARCLHEPAGGAASDEPWHRLESEEVATRLGTDPARGLDIGAADRHLAAVGLNSVPVPPGRSPLDIALDQFRSLPTLLLLGAGLASLLSGGVADALAIFGVVLLNAGIGYAVESRAEQTIRLLGHESVANAQVLRDGQRLEVPAERLVPGDLMLLARGTAVCADARLCRAHDLFADEARLTGESEPVHKDPACLRADVVALADRHNMVWRGTVVTSGTGAAVVVATGVHTEIGRLQRLLGNASHPPTPMERELARLGRWLTWLSIALGGLAASIGLARGLALGRMLHTSIALAIAAIPEGLPTVASTTLARGVELMRRKGVLVRRLDALETLGAVQVLCFDKTGTLTLNRMEVAAIACAGREFDGTRLPAVRQDPALSRLLEIAVLCSEVSIDPSDGTLTGSETELALMRLARDRGIDARALRATMPATAIRHRSEAYRFMATIHAMPGGAVMTAVKGDPLEVLELCEWRLADGAVGVLTAEEKAAVSRLNAAMAGRALRVLGFAFRTDNDSAPEDISGLVWVGLAGLADGIRDGAAPLMGVLRRAQIHPLVLTGDQVATARAIAERLGLNGYGPSVVVDSVELAAMAPRQIVAAARRAHVFARVSPAEKLRIVRALQDASVVVGMVGDGFNDSLALKAANVGIAMGGSGAEVARDAADIVMQTEELTAVAAAIEEGRAAHANVRRATGYLTATNLSEMAFVIGGMVGGLSQPLSAAQLLWINIVSDVLPAVGLSAEPPEAGTMRHPPYVTRQAILGGSDMPRLLTEAGIMAGGALLSTSWGALRFGAGAEARAMGFGSLLLGQLLHALNCRASGTGTNPAFAGTLGLAFAAQALAVAVPGLRRTLGIVPLGPSELAMTLAGALLPWLVNRMLRPDQSAAMAERTGETSGSPACSFASST